MFCAFAGIRRSCDSTARADLLPNDPGWDVLAAHFEIAAGTRQIVVADIDRVQTSCGFGVPMFDFIGHRDLLPAWAQKKGADGLAEYRRNKNALSIDGLPTTVGKPDALTWHGPPAREGLLHGLAAHPLASDRLPSYRFSPCSRGHEFVFTKECRCSPSPSG